jgi:hypothetical protein
MRKNIRSVKNTIACTDIAQRNIRYELSLCHRVLPEIFKQVRQDQKQTVTMSHPQLSQEAVCSNI